MKLDPLNIGLIITTLVTVLAGWASQRAATKTGRINAKEQAELEAYSRARAMDLQTIVRQDEEIADLTADNKRLREDKRVRDLENEKLRTTQTALVKQNAEQARVIRELKARAENEK